MAEMVKSGVGVGQAPSACLTFSRPPVAVMPAIDEIKSTFDKILSRRLAVLSALSAHSDSTRAAAPETWGVAMDVPLK